MEGNTDPIRFELQQARREDFAEASTRYQGLDRATYVSGLPSGDFYYRVRIIGKDNQPGAWSDTLVVRVEYVSMKLVFGLMAAGVVVFAATVLTVLTGHHRAARARAVEP